MDYIEAFFSNDLQEMAIIEEKAKAVGTGPRSGCATVANFSTQRSYCCKLFWSLDNLDIDALLSI